MRVRFQADADLDGRILRGLRRAVPEIDMRTAADAALAGLKDPEVLRIAADSARILVSQDRRTMPAHSLASRQALRVPESFCCAKQFPSRQPPKSSYSFGARARPRNGMDDSSGFRYENSPPICPRWLRTRRSHVRVMPGAPPFGYPTNGCVMSRGRTHKSNCSAVRKPSLRAASRKPMSSR